MDKFKNITPFVCIKKKCCMAVLAFIIFGVAFSFPFTNLKAQEFNCKVSINSQEIQTTEKKVFESMQTAIYEFVNNRRWTNNTYKPHERLDCNIGLIMTAQTSRTDFKATISVQLRRPVYNSNYTTTLFNYMETDFNFTYDDSQPIEFEPNSFMSNLSSSIAFYLYIFLGIDADSYSPYGGSAYFVMARSILETASNSSYKGWRAQDGNKNYYWMMENYTNPVYNGLHDAYYKYHRLGLDMMTVSQPKARASIIDALKTLEPVYKEKPGLFAIQLFIDSKIDEIISIFAPAPDDEKATVIALIKKLSPINTQKIEKGLAQNQ